MSVFNTKVKEIGREADLFKEEKMLILFGLEAPDSLADYCYKIEVNPMDGEITESNKLVIDSEEFDIMAVGNVVNKNLATLGHITIKFDGSTTAELPGTLYVEDKGIPVIKIDSTIAIK